MKLLKRLLLLLVVLTVVGAAGIAYTVHHSLARVEGHYFDADGVRLHYTDEGTGEPVVLMHGFAFDADLNWRKPGITQALSEHYRVIALDARGHGLSEKPHAPEAYGEEMPRDIVRLLDHLGIEKAHVIGYSMGGFITLKLLVMFPERLLSAAPCGIGRQEVTEDNSALIERIATALRQEHSFTPLLEHLDIRASGAALKVGAWVLSSRNDFDALAAVMEAFPGLALPEDSLRANTVPTLCIAGDRDPLAATAGQLHALLANSALVSVPGAGHGAVPGRPLFLESLQAFLAAPAQYVEQANTP